MAKVKAEACWGALHAIGAKDGTADQIHPTVIAKLIEFEMVLVTANGLPELTAKGQLCFCCF